MYLKLSNLGGKRTSACITLLLYGKEISSFFKYKEAEQNIVIFSLICCCFRINGRRKVQGKEGKRNTGRERKGIPEGKVKKRIWIHEEHILKSTIRSDIQRNGGMQCKNLNKKLIEKKNDVKMDYHYERKKEKGRTKREGKNIN